MVNIIFLIGIVLCVTGINGLKDLQDLNTRSVLTTDFTNASIPQVSETRPTIFRHVSAGPQPIFGLAGACAD